MKDVLEAKTYGHSAGPEYLKQVARMKRGSYDGNSYEKPEDHNCGVSKLATQQAHTLTTLSLPAETSKSGFSRRSKKNEYDENYNSQNEVREKLDRGIDDFAAALPRIRKIDWHPASRSKTLSDKLCESNRAGARCGAFAWQWKQHRDGESAEYNAWRGPINPNAAAVKPRDLDDVAPCKSATAATSENTAEINAITLVAPNKK